MKGSTSSCIIHKNLGRLINKINVFTQRELSRLAYENIKDFIQYLDKEKKFFNNVDEINQYNIGAIAELIQYYNIKEYSHPIYKKSEIRREIKKYFSC